MKNVTVFFSASLMVLALAGTSFAASFAGKVVGNDGEKVTLQVAKGVPAWAKKGAVLSAAGGMPTVIEVKGNDITLRFSKAKAARIKPNMTLSVSEPSKGDGAEHAQGC